MEQELYLKRIQDFYEQKKRMPSVREIRDFVIKTHSMRKTKQVIDQLVEEGFLRKDNKGFLQPTTEMLGIRKLGSVQAGFPSPAEEELSDTITLDEWLINNKQATYMLKVSGDSMIEAGIRPGDTALVERGIIPKNNDIVIAQVDGKWTMKYYQKKGSAVALVPANPKFPIIYPQYELRVEAVVTAIIRKLK